MPKGKAVSVSISDVPATRENYRALSIAMTVEDGSVWFRFRSESTDWQWTEWECLYTPDPA